jgi:hypothetical protein
MNNAIRAAWDASRWQFAPDYTYDQFADAISDWECWPVEVGGEMAGALLVKGCEIHACIKPEFFRRWATPGMYRRVMRHKALYGRLVTRVNVDHDAGREFVERFGFTMTGNTGHVLHYEMR